MPTFDPGSLEGRSRIDHIEEYLQSPKADSLIRSQIVTSARNVLAETYPFACAGGSSALSASLGHSCAIGLRKGDVVTNIVTFIQTAQAPTIMQGGLYTKTGTHLGHTASLGASIVSSTFWVAPLTSPVTITSDDAYYPIIMSQGAATQPSLMRLAGAVGGTGLSIGSGIGGVVSTAAVADLTANVTFSNTSPVGFWIAVN